MFHLVCDVIVRHADGEWLLMRRDAQKTFGGMWEATAGGSALAAVRELREETGIKAQRIAEVGRVVSDAARTLYIEYFCETESAKDAVVLQKGETSAYRWVTTQQLLSLGGDELVTKRMQRFIPALRAEELP